MKIAFIVGTRPELIKVAPVIWEAKKRNLNYDVVNTAQHKDLLTPYWKTFEIEPTHQLDVMKSDQSLSSLASRAIYQLQEYVENVDVKPDIILAQGDTTTVMAASMVSFFNKISFAHLEAGLRSYDFENPYPEEYNRKVAAISAKYHLCPTQTSHDNLVNESIDKSKVFIVGNTVVDALNSVSKKFDSKQEEWNNPNLSLLKNFQDSALITCHRRENQGEALQRIILSINELADQNPNTCFVWTLHPNPNVRKHVLKSDLANKSNVLLVEPLDYFDILKLLKRSFCAISDSGGIQEEAPSMDTPVLVLREKTERPEGVEAGLAFLVGTNKDEILSKYEYLKEKKIDFGINPYGDGNSSKLVMDILTN